MDVQTAGRTIQLILAPVVMVTACGILLTGMWAHYGAVNERIRQLVAERFGLASVRPDEDRLESSRERLAEIDHQVPMLVRRHQLVHHAIVLANSAVVVLVVSMFVIAAAALSDSSSVGTVALFIFLLGTALLMAAAVYMVAEVRISHASVAYEAMQVINLPVRWITSPGPAEP